MLRANARALAVTVAPARLMAVVKADAYGHGAAAVAPALEADGVSSFAVATTAEGIRLRAAGVRGDVLVFGAPFEADLAAARAHGLAVTASSVAAVERIAASARAGDPLRVHVKVDTGMHRLGLAPGEVATALDRLRAAPGVVLDGLWTHYATADAHADAQAARLGAFDGLAPDVPRHALASGPLVAGHGGIGPASFVRTGILLYGLAPDGDPATATAAGVRPAMRLVARVAQVRTVAAGESVSYGRTWTARQPTRIATVAAGYADGLPRLTSNRGAMGVGGRLYPIAGVVCMDMTMLELGAPGGPGDAVREGDEAVVFGPVGPAAEDVARWAETIPYEVVCRVSARVPRVHHDGPGA